MQDLTILLSLKDKSEYTLAWTKNNIFSEFKYIVADGSLNNENQKYFKNINCPNLTYIRYEPDLTIKDYLKKLKNAYERVETKYVMACDNDDYIFKKGLLNIINELNSNPEINLIQGNIGLVKKILNKYKKINKVYISNKFKNDNNKLSILRKSILDYNPLWYCVSETKIQREIFDLILDSGTDNIYVVEQFQTFLSLLFSEFKFVDDYYYCRLVDQKNSSHTELFNKYQLDCVFNDKFNKSIQTFISFISLKLKINKSDLFDLFRSYYLSKLEKNNLRLKMIIKQYIKFKLENFFVLLNKGIKNEKNISNLF